MRSILFTAAMLIPLACSASDDPQCRVGADCASGVCRGDGTCAPVQPSKDGAADAEPDAEQPEGSTAEDAAGDETTEGGSGVCSPDNDGVITREEVPLRAGLNAKFKIAANAPVNTAGSSSEGLTTWDFSGELPGDHLSIVELQDMQGTWFAPKFPTASYASRLSDSQTLLGVFQITDTQLLLLGVVSPADGVTRTELTYEPPVVVLGFPLQQAATWSTDAAVSGLASGVLSAYSEKYESQVDAAGKVVTPYGAFPALRIRTLLTRTLGYVPTTTRTFLYVTECFGTVAAVTSKANESAVEFTTAAELKRLAP